MESIRAEIDMISILPYINGISQYYGAQMEVEQARTPESIYIYTLVYSMNYMNLRLIYNNCPVVKEQHSLDTDTKEGIECASSIRCYLKSLSQRIESISFILCYVKQLCCFSLTFCTSHYYRDLVRNTINDVGYIYYYQYYCLFSMPKPEYTSIGGIFTPDWCEGLSGQE